MNLHYQKIGSGRPLLILHGLFGSSDNWLTIGKALSDKFEVWLIDQRNHGRSPHSEQFDYPSMSDDISHFIATHQIDNPIILGHSMGGKAAMEYAMRHPEGWYKLVVVDIAPRGYPVHHQTILKGLNSFDPTAILSRPDADQKLAAYISEVGVRQFLLKNLVRSDSGYQWRINLPAITANIEAIGQPTESEGGIEKPVLFIKGARSDYIRDEDKSLIKKLFPHAQLATIEEAGHWVHAEQPKRFLAVLKQFVAGHA